MAKHLRQWDRTKEFIKSLYEIINFKRYVYTIE